MVGAIVTPIIGSRKATMSGSRGLHRARATRACRPDPGPAPPGWPPPPARARAPPSPRPGRPAPGASLTSALSPIRGIDAWPARPEAADREAEHALLAGAHAVERPPVVLEPLARALVDHQVGPHLVRVLAAQPLGAVLGAGLLVGGDHDQQLARPAGASPRAPAPPRPRSRRPPGSSCPRRRGPTRSRRGSRPTTGPPASRRGRPAPCPRGPAGTASGRRTSPASRAIRFGRPSTSASSSTSKPAPSEQVAQELLGGLLVAGRVDRVEADQALQQLGGVALQISWLRHPARGCHERDIDAEVTHAAAARRDPACVLASMR